MGEDSSTKLRDNAFIKERFVQISEKIKELQMTHAEWQKFVTARKELGGAVENHNSTLALMYLKVVVLLLLLISLVPLLLIAIHATGMIPNDSRLDSFHRGVVRFFLEDVSGLKMGEEQCIIPFSEIVQDVFRPPVECNTCSSVTSVDIVENLTPSQFEEKYAYSSRPVVVIDGMNGWTAVDSFSFDYFKGVYEPGSRALESAESDCQFFPYKTSFESLGDVFEMSTDEAYLRNGSKPWYIGWSNCDSAAANVLRKHYKRPYFLPPESESSKTDWIFMGSPGYGAPLHIDAVDLPSWQAQVKGHKEWTLAPPPECYFECAPEITVTVHPGQIIVLDTNKWFHGTHIVGDEMSITIGSEYD